MGTVNHCVQPNMNQQIALSLFFVVACAAFANAGTIFILDDGLDEAPLLRTKRDTGYAPAPVYPPAPLQRAERDSGYPAAHPKGRVGPVPTCGAAGPPATFKWGVRHRAGVQYGR